MESSLERIGNSCFSCWDQNVCWVCFLASPDAKLNHRAHRGTRVYNGAMQKVCHSEKWKFHTSIPPNRVTNGLFVITKSHFSDPLPPLWVTYVLHGPYLSWVTEFKFGDRVKRIYRNRKSVTFLCIVFKQFCRTFERTFKIQRTVITSQPHLVETSRWTKVETNRGLEWRSAQGTCWYAHSTRFCHRWHWYIKLFYYFIIPDLCWNVWPIPL